MDERLSVLEEGRILHLIKECGGSISLSILRDVYRLSFGTSLNCPKGKFREWIEASDSIDTKKRSGTNDYVAFERGISRDKISDVEEGNILQLIRNNSGSISLSLLRNIYKDTFGTTLICPKRKFREWIEASDLIGTRKSGSDHVVAFEKVLTYSERNNSLTDVSDEVQSRGGSDVFIAVRNELDTIVESDDTEPEIGCDEIVEKLMGYAGGQFKPTVVHQEVLSLLNILPMRWSDSLASIGMANVIDICLDLNRRPYCWVHGERRYLLNDNSHVVEDRDIHEIVTHLQDFGGDNRAGIDGQLHRISCIRSNKNEIIGLTIRVGRHIEGNSDMVRDLLEESDKSILLLGEPGSGKTTIVRDVAKILSRTDNVFIVDTSNEIAGDGNVPHMCVGDSRRMMVKSLPSQADTMIECVQNHTPSVMIIDEIGRKREVEAAQTSKNRGVRMIASAHGDLRSLIKNKDIRGLIGGLETVTLGDVEAKEVQKKTGSKSLPKQLTTRAASPIFEIIIELKRGRHNEWHIILNSAKAVDEILLGEKYDVQKRLRCMNSGSIFVENVKN